jgi:hypothetical protein
MRLGWVSTIKILMLQKNTKAQQKNEYGASKEGYWNYERMVLQLEDFVDIIKVLWPQYDCLFLFNHSCGHDTIYP